MRHCRRYALLVALIAGCEGADFDLGGFEVGVDDGGAFAPLEDGDTILVEHGFQGGVHVTLAAAADAAADELFELHVRLHGDTAVPIAASRFVVSFDEGAATGLTVVLPSVDSVADRDVRIEATLDGNVSERTVRCEIP